MHSQKITSKSSQRGKFLPFLLAEVMVVTLSVGKFLHFERVIMESKTGHWFYRNVKVYNWDEGERGIKLQGIRFDKNYDCHQ